MGIIIGKYKSYKILFFLVIILGSQKVFCQNKNIQVGFASGLFIGGQLNISYNLTLGARINYFFLHQKKFNYFATSGISTSLFGRGATLKTIDLGIGVQYDLLTIWNNNLYVSFNAGALYYNEQFSTQLIEQIVKKSYDEYGFRANFGIGYSFPKCINYQFNYTLLNTNGRTYGLNVYYNF